MKQLSDEQIDAIAEPFMRKLGGDHWYKGEDGIADVEGFARAVIAEFCKINGLDCKAQPAREWVGLTDEDIRPLCGQNWVFETVKQWVRIIESKLREKNAGEPYQPLTVREVEDLNAMAFGAPCGEDYALEALLPIIRQYEALRESGARPADPADVPLRHVEEQPTADDKAGEAHSCSYYCDRPKCVKAQRDDLRDRLAEQRPISDATEAVTRAVTQVEKLLCEKLGREWAPSGMSIQTLVDELADDKAGVDVAGHLMPSGDFIPIEGARDMWRIGGVPLYTRPQQVADNNAATETPPECQTEAEKKAFAFGWWKAMEKAPTPQAIAAEAKAKELDRCIRIIRAQMRRYKEAGKGVEAKAAERLSILIRRQDNAV